MLLNRKRMDCLMGTVERTITYAAPWVRCERVEDYRVGWQFIESEASDPSASSPQ